MSPRARNLKSIPRFACRLLCHMNGGQASDSGPAPRVSLDVQSPSQHANPFARLTPRAKHAIVSHFTLESGVEMREVEVAYQTFGQLNEHGDNAMVICHALTGSSDVEDWWGPLVGAERAFDPTRYFIFAANVLGSPYGTSSPVTLDPATGKRYGPTFPRVSVRDDVRLHRLVLEALGVRSVAVVVGGSMGGMAVLEWPLCSPPGFVRQIVPIATSARHSAWGISWGEAQRQSIYSDDRYQDGEYELDDPPSTGLAAARMSALLTYRSRDSFEDRFARKTQPSPVTTPATNGSADRAALEHNDGHRLSRRAKSSVQQDASDPAAQAIIQAPIPESAPLVFSAQGYLRYQGACASLRPCSPSRCQVHLPVRRELLLVHVRAAC